MNFPLGHFRKLTVGFFLSGSSREDDLKHTLEPLNCFSAVIEKIERLYMGRESSDEEERNVPDNDQYDTEDSFIDDTELACAEMFMPLSSRKENSIFFPCKFDYTLSFLTTEIQSCGVRPRPA